MINTVYEIKIKVTGPAYRLFQYDGKFKNEICNLMNKEYHDDAGNKYDLANCGISDELDPTTRERFMLIQSVEPYTSHFVAHEIESKICSFINDQLRQFSVELNDVLGR